MAESEKMEHGQWSGNTQGLPWMHHLLIGSLKYLNLRFVYLGMAVFVVPFYMLFAHKGYITMYHYFRRRRGYGVGKAFCYVYKNHYRFGQIIIDRFATYAGLHFQVKLDGFELFERLNDQPGGFMIVSCHVGNYEMAGYVFQAPKKRFNALVFSGEAKAVMENRSRMFLSNNIRMVPALEDMSHVFVMNSALANGEIVSLPGDRIYGSPRFVECSFLGAKAHFPLGPYAMALQREVPTIAIFVMKESPYAYVCYIRQIKADDKPYANRKDKAANLAQHFAQEMENVLKKYPEQWFNYYEFWNDRGQES